MPFPDSPPLRGEIYWIDWDPGRGSEQIGHRPGVVISINSFNERMDVVVVAALTTSIRPESRLAVNLPAGQPLQRAGQILPWQIMTITKLRLENFAGGLTGEQLSDLNQKLRLCWGLQTS